MFQKSGVKIINFLVSLVWLFLVINVFFVFLAIPTKAATACTYTSIKSYYATATDRFFGIYAKNEGRFFY